MSPATGSRPPTGAPYPGSGFLDGEVSIDGSSFHVVPVGTHGGIELRNHEVVADVELFGLVDGMPTRPVELE